MSSPSQSSSEPLEESGKVKTQMLCIDPESVEEEPVQRLIEESVVPLLKNGFPIAIPTETVYGLAANALDPLAISKIFVMKGRPSDNPLIVHISSLDQLPLLVAPHALPQPGSVLSSIINAFWPGPLTILFDKSDNVPMCVTGGLGRVAVRMPSHPVARKIIELSGLPLAAPSANRSGRPSPTSADHVMYDISSESPLLPDGVEPVRCVVDGGECFVGVESTVLDLSFQGSPTILRPGSITVEDLKPFLPDLQVYRPLGQNQDPHKAHDSSSPSTEGPSSLSEEDRKKMEIESRPATPGLKYRHYSPNAPIVLVEFTDPDRPLDLERLSSMYSDRLNRDLSEGKRIGVIHTNSSLRTELEKRGHKLGEEDLLHQVLSGEVVIGQKEGKETMKVYNIENDVPSFARQLFGLMRHLDQVLKVDVIFIEAVSESGIGLAVMNRARKASSETINPL